MNWVLDDMEATSNIESDALEVTNLMGKQPSIMESQVFWPETSPHVIMDTQALDVQIVNRCVMPINGSDTTSNDSHLFRVDNNDLVEELLMKNFKNPNLLVTDGSSKGAQMGQQHHQLEVGSGKGNSNGGPDSKDKQLDTSVSSEAVGNMSLPGQKVREHLIRRQSNQDNNNTNTEHLTNSNTISNGSLFLSDGIRTKFLSASGTSHFLVKNTLKGKGVVCKYPVTRDGISVVGMGQNNEKVAAVVARVASDALPNLNSKADEPSLKSVDSGGPYSLHEGISLADWLRPGYRKVDKVQSLCIFGKILHLVDLAHSQQIVLRDLRPSCFKLLPSNQVKYVGSLGQKELFESISDHEIPSSHNHLSTKRNFGESMQAYPSSLTSKHQKLSENMRFSGPPQQFPTRSGFNRNEVSRNGIKLQSSGNDTGERHNSMSSERRLWNTIVSKRARPQVTPNNVQLEDQWYTSPEELNERGTTFATNIYCLGVLLFELLCHSESREVHTSTMLKLHHRILPPNFLSENPKEAGFCLWLLHPVPSSRPTTREILQSELIGESQELLEDQSSLSVEEDDTESELLLHFLLSLKEQKHKHASKLVGDIESLQTDIQEVEKRYLSKTNGVLPLKQSNSSNTREPKFTHKSPLNTEPLSRLAPVSDMNAARLMKNINQLENAYFSMRSQIQHPDTRATARLDTDLLKNQSRSSQAMNGSQAMNQKPADRLGTFFEGLCKYARYGKFEVHGTVRNGDLLNSASANVICSLSFDRDEDFFAAAGVSKKIKIFDYHRLLDDAIDIHYPVIEMSSKSKLSCICWNNYIKNYLASTDYDGVVQLWDASTGQGFAQYAEHERRAWSVDFSPVDPRKLASGGDDCSVKLWSINEKKCIGSIRNVANVCCVQFSPHSTNLLAFGSADYKTYCYDLRQTRIPWCTLAGHGKTVSYVKFLDEETLVSASTDNTLKLWDLNKTSFSALSTSCSLTFKGHTNEKNFVGLAVSDDGYIACGSETNEVYAYYKSLSMPITSHKFGSIDPISGQETSDDNGQFVSSVCWRKKSSTVVASNSSGTIKLLQMVSHQSPEQMQNEKQKIAEGFAHNSFTHLVGEELTTDNGGVVQNILSIAGKAMVSSEKGVPLWES